MIRTIAIIFDLLEQNANPMPHINCNKELAIVKTINDTIIPHIRFFKLKSDIT